MIEITDELLERVGRAIEAARCPNREGPYGGYDYSSYGNPTPYHVRDFRDPKSDTWGRTVFRSNDRDAMHREYERLTRAHIALAAIQAIQSEE